MHLLKLEAADALATFIQNNLSQYIFDKSFASKRLTILHWLIIFILVPRIAI